MLIDDGESCVEIAKFLYLDDDTVQGWHKSYREGGWDALSTDAGRISDSFRLVTHERFRVLA